MIASSAAVPAVLEAHSAVPFWYRTRFPSPCMIRVNSPLHEASDWLAVSSWLAVSRRQARLRADPAGNRSLRDRGSARVHHVVSARRQPEPGRVEGDRAVVGGARGDVRE